MSPWILTGAAFVLFIAVAMASGGKADILSSSGAARTLSAPQIAQLAANAGFTGADLQTAVAVALAESYGNTQAYNPEAASGAPQGQGSYGLWQIFLNKHPEFSGWNLYDPTTNANAAYSVYASAGNSFEPWATYTSGAYSAFLAQAQSAVTA